MKACATASLCIVTFAFSMVGYAKTPVSVSDCVNVRYLNRDYYHPAIQLAPNGFEISYVVKSPNLSENRNDMKLYVKAIDSNQPNAAGRLLLTSPTISQVRWLKDNRHLLLIAGDHGDAVVSMLDSRDGRSRTIARADADITEYSLDASETELLFVTTQNGRQDAQIASPLNEARGYEISLRDSAHISEPTKKLYFQRRVRGRWTSARQLSIQSPATHERLSAFHGSMDMHLSISPDGRRFTITYLAGADVPDRWKQSPLVRSRLDAGGSAMVTVVHDLTTGEDTVPLQSASVFSVPMWSFDSRSFAVVAEAPVGSQWQSQDEVQHLGVTTLHLFHVDVTVTKVEEIVPHVEGIQGPLYWGRDGVMLVHTAPNELVRMKRRADGSWERVSTIHLPIAEGFSHGELTADGTNIAGDLQAEVTPPLLFLYRNGEPGVRTIVNLNPQFQNLDMAPVEHVHWTTTLGEDVSGVLLKPIGYRRGVRYPLVIQTKPVSGQFLCDTGESHYPSFAPQPMAISGMMYLALDDSEGHGFSRRPTGYPGGIAEAAQQMDVWDRGVQELAREGVIDPERVGIIGFSRSGWYTEFILTHSTIPYKAATLADNVSYMLSEYWLFHTQANIRGFDAMYGGPPYGDTLANWIKYSPSFALEKIHTPVLMEVMGYGTRFDHIDSPPILLSARDELFVGLARLGKPVEMYYYPNEDHQPDHPLARLSSLQRNVDWYRFWLQGYERPGVEDHDQYSRWRKLRDLRDKNEADVRSSVGSTPSK